MVWPSRKDRKLHSKVWASAFHNVSSVIKHLAWTRCWMIYNLWYILGKCSVGSINGMVWPWKTFVLSKKRPKKSLISKDNWVKFVEWKATMIKSTPTEYGQWMWSHVEKRENSCYWFYKYLFYYFFMFVSWFQLIIYLHLVIKLWKRHFDGSSFFCYRFFLKIGT